jgi:hypothetical protein
VSLAGKNARQCEGSSVQILASALPGFRDLRAPLTAGYLWLVFLWIVLKPDVSTRPTNAIAGALYDLGKHVGPIWIGIGVSVTAYLVGSISQLFSGPLNRTAELLIHTLKLPSALAGYGGQDNSALLDGVKHQRTRGLQKIGNPTFEGTVRDISDRQRKEYLQLTDRIDAAERSLQMELNLPATLLVGKEPELFTETDRLKAESQLRLSIVPPLIAIVSYVSIEDNWRWFFLVIPVCILWAQGHRRDLEFKSLMASAFQQGLVRSQTLENLKEWVDGLPTIRNEGGGSMSIRESNRDGA